MINQPTKVFSNTYLRLTSELFPSTQGISKTHMNAKGEHSKVGNSDPSESSLVGSLQRPFQCWVQQGSLKSLLPSSWPGLHRHTSAKHQHPLIPAHTVEHKQLLGSDPRPESVREKGKGQRSTTFHINRYGNINALGIQHGNITHKCWFHHKVTLIFLGEVFCYIS